MLTFSPIKTYRLFVQLRLQGKLKADMDWIRRDNTICIDVARFFVELEAKGYKHFLHEDYREVNTNDFNGHHMKSDEIERNQLNETIDENITKNYDEVQSDDNKRFQSISNDDNSHQLKSNDNTMTASVTAGEISETLKTKEEMIAVLKEGIARAEREAQYLRDANKDLSQQNQQLTKLTFLLMAPPVPENAAKERTWRNATVEEERPVHIPVERDAEFIDADTFQQQDSADVQTHTPSS